MARATGCCGISPKPVVAEIKPHNGAPTLFIDDRPDTGLMLYHNNVERGHDEIADFTSLPVGTVKSRLYYAIRRIARDLGEADLSDPARARLVAERLDIPLKDSYGLGKLQVEMAQLKYMLPLLTAKDDALSRLTGGIVSTARWLLRCGRALAVLRGCRRRAGGRCRRRR